MGEPFIACFPTFAQVTQDWPLKSLPFTMPTVGVGETEAVYPDLYLHVMPSLSWHSFYSLYNRAPGHNQHAPALSWSL